VGELMAARAKERGVEKVVFDRGGYVYHGRVQALAEGAAKKVCSFRLKRRRRAWPGTSSARANFRAGSCTSTGDQGGEGR